MELARGTVADRPWAVTLAMLARRNASGQLTLVSVDKKRYSVAIARGAIVAARSPQAADSVARVALTGGFASAAQVAELTKRLEAMPSRDEVDVLAALTRMGPAQVFKLRHEVIVRGAARMFAIDEGEWLFEDRTCLPPQGIDVDVHTVVYRGIRMHLSESRLERDLHALGGGRFVLEPGAAEELVRYGFCDGEWPVMVALREGASLAELEQRFREIDPRTLRATLLALGACGTVRTVAVGRTPTPPTISRTKTNPELAAEAADRAERALQQQRPDLAVLAVREACKLVPSDADYHALLGWSLFCAADDKRAMAPRAKQLIETSLPNAQRPHQARFYLGRLERMLGRDREALNHFHAVLLLHPQHREASAEIRVLEARLRRSSFS